MLSFVAPTFVAASRSSSSETLAASAPAGSSSRRRETFPSNLTRPVIPSSTGRASRLADQWLRGRAVGRPGSATLPVMFPPGAIDDPALLGDSRSERVDECVAVRA